MASLGHGNIIVVENDGKFQQEIDGAGNRLVVVDFTASWCGPCQKMAPIFAQLSVKYSAAIFLKVDVDQCKRTAALQGIRAMPTFYFFKNRQKVDEMKGADAAGLENRINQWIGGAVDTITADPKRVAIGRSWDCFELLVDNPLEVFMDVSQLLLKFASNIISNPDNPKYRSIRVGNKVFQSRLLPVNGAVECLFAMGFQERGDHLVFPSGTPLEGLMILQDTLNDERNHRGVNGELMPQAPQMPQQHEQSPCSQPSIIRQHSSDGVDAEKDFLLRLQSSVQHVLLYEEPDLQCKARSLIPVIELGRRASEASTRTKQSGEAGVSERDCLVLELLAWFKGSFFKWVDKPLCPACGGHTVPLGVVPPTADEVKWGAGNVESYKCSICGKMTRFPRYNHPGKLLETRSGRCGEWANCFTLLCRAMGFEARHVLDWTDHVWTEVYSESQQRWLHCDACENTCDKPLLYEAGWGKKLSYIIAFSHEQVLDVTWRYSAKHDEVRQRRTSVCEKWLEKTLNRITEERQMNLSEERRQVLTERSVKELVEFFTIKSVISADELHGRTSGSLAWRLLRGETKQPEADMEHTSYIFKPTDEEVKDRRLRICYSCASDKYFRGSKLTADITGWKSGVAAVSSMFRKVETDWEMVYLARKETSSTGSVTWQIDFTSSNLVIDSVTLVTRSKSFVTGQVVWTLTGDDDQNETFSGGHDPIKTSSLSGSKSLKLTASLSGGKGDVAWQHAQLFRQPISNEDDYPLDILVLLRDP